MNSIKLTAMLIAITISSTLIGCAKPLGTSPSDKRASAQQMKKTTLEELYESKPETKKMIKKSAGYGVFSNVNINLFIASAGQGYGVVVDNKTGKQTYMKMAQVGVGLGLGAKDFRAVIIFNNPDTMNSFVNSGWEFGAHADAAAKAEDKGGSASGAVSAKDMTIYQITKAGLALQATVAGTKYWKDDSLN